MRAPHRRIFRRRLARALAIALLITSPLLNALASPAAAVTITIDGQFSDWTSATASFTDPTSDAGGGSTDISKVWLTADGTAIYVRWDSTLPTNKNKVASDGFSVSIDTTGGTTVNTRVWVLFSAQGAATVQLEKPLGTFTATGEAQQLCAVTSCANGAPSSIEMGMSLASLGVSASTFIAVQAETRASTATNSSIKDCVPGGTTCNGWFYVDTSGGAVTTTPPSPSPSPTPAPTSTPSPTSAPSVPATSPTSSTPAPTTAPTAAPTVGSTPSAAPAPTVAPTPAPAATATSTLAPTPGPTATSLPTFLPTPVPTVAPTPATVFAPSTTPSPEAAPTPATVFAPSTTPSPEAAPTPGATPSTDAVPAPEATPGSEATTSAADPAASEPGDVSSPSGTEAVARAPTATDTSDSARVTLFEFANTRAGGFTPRTTGFIRIMGSRTVGLFVLPETVEAIDDVAIVASLRDTAARRAAAYAWVEAAEVTSAPQSGARPSLDEDEAALLAAMELPGAVPVDGANADHWLRVTIAVAGYVPWSRVHVVVTSDPLVVASAVVGPKGSAVIDAVIPLDALGAGAHRIRVVGDRDLGGVAVDASGAIVIPADVLDEIQTFDQRTTAIVEVFGEQLAGGNRRLTRYIPIRGDFPWWLLIPGAVANVFVLLARRRRLFATGRRRGGVFGLLGVTAAITSWIAWALFWPELIVGIAALLALGAILVIRSAPSPGRTEVRPAASRV